MADISKITTLDGQTHNIKDSLARSPKYGVCSTAADTASKTVTIDNISELTTGLCIQVKFTYANTAATPTLQVNSLDAKPIKRYGTTAPGTSEASSWNADSVITLTYDGTNWIMNDTGVYAGAAVAGGVANGTQAIPYGVVDGTSTATAFTATIAEITELKDGTCVLLKNSVVTSASGFTININGLGAKPVYSNMATGNPITPTNPTQESTIFNINYTMLFVYSTTLVTGGCWICYRGYNSDTNTIAYQIRKNNTLMPTAIRSRYYRLFFTAADNAHWEPANTGYDSSATSKKTVNTRPINPFGAIAYTSASTNYTAGTNVAVGTLWYQYALALGYSFNTTGAALTLTYPAPVYVKCAPQSDGSAIIDSTTPYVQALPNTADGKIYIYLGMAYSATNVELHIEHPIYEYKNGAIRLYTNASIPSKVSDLTNDSGFITTETDPTVPAWAKAVNKPSYTASEVGAIANPVSANEGDILTYNGTTWVTEEFPNADAVGAIPAPIDPVEGHVLTYDGSDWIGEEVSGIPDGGTADQVLAKASNTDGDAGWVTLAFGVDDASAVGSAIVGTATTSEPNYIPAGEIDYTIRNNRFVINGLKFSGVKFSVKPYRTGE